jgi:hypothetical protein
MKSALFGLFTAAVLTLSAPIAHAETFEFLGEVIEVKPPQGLCAVGQTDLEKKYMKYRREMTKPAGALTQMAVPCDQLAKFRAGEVEGFTYWAQVMVLKREGQLYKSARTRAQFVQYAAGVSATEKIDYAEANRRVDEHLSKAGASATMSDLVPLGVRDNAFFCSMRMKFKEGDGPEIPMNVVMAVTLAKKLPVVVQVYRTPQAGQVPLLKIAGQYAAKVIELN